VRTPTGNVPVPVTRDELSHYLALPEETQRIIRELSPEQFIALRDQARASGEEAPGVAEEPGAATSDMDTLAKELKEKRASLQRAFDAAGAFQKVTEEARERGMETIVRAMFGRGANPVDALNRAGRAGILQAYPWTGVANWEMGKPVWKDFVMPTLPTGRAPAWGTPEWDAYWKQMREYRDWRGSAGYKWFEDLQKEYDRILGERAETIASQRLIPIERAKKLALKEFRAPTGGAKAGRLMPTTWS